jgi:hypothetical protein
MKKAAMVALEGRRFAGTALAVLVAFGAGAAAAQTPPTNFGSVTNLNQSIGDVFNLGTQPPLTGNFNFVDVYTFTFVGAAQGVTSGSVIDFSYSAPTAITDLQAAVFTNGTFLAGTYVGASGVVDGAEGDTGASATVLGAWTSGSLGPTGSFASFNANLVGGTTYEVEIRGQIGTSGNASYGGNLQVAAIPEPSTLAMLPLGLVLVGGVLARARRPRERVSPGC